MYQAHQTYWFIVGFCLCVGLVTALAAFTHLGRIKLPNFVFILPIGVAFLLVFSMNWLRVRDNSQLRSELRDLNPLALSNVVVSGGGVRRQLAETNEFIPLFKQLQQVRPVAAHHSYPTDSVNVGFMIDGHAYQYRVGRDSERNDEFWVWETARAGEPGREIGRIESAALKPVLEKIMTNQP
jgi:hypothetical protein